MEWITRGADLDELNAVPTSFGQCFWEFTGKVGKLLGYEERLRMECLPNDKCICSNFSRL